MGAKDEVGVAKICHGSWSICLGEVERMLECAIWEGEEDELEQIINSE